MVWTTCSNAHDWLVGDAVLLVVELTVGEEASEDDGDDREGDGDDEQDVHVVGPGVVEGVSLWAAQWVGGNCSRRSRVEGETSRSIGVSWEVSEESVWNDVGLDSSQDGGTDGASEFGPEEDEAGDHGDILVRHGNLCGQLESDTKHTAAEALNALGHNELGGCAALVPVGDHETHAQDANEGASDERPLEPSSGKVQRANCDTEDGQTERLSIGKVSCIGNGPSFEDDDELVDRGP